MKIVSFITLLFGVAAAAAAESAASSSEGNDNGGVGSVLHGFKNDVVQEQLKLHLHHREQEGESVRGALRGFKKKGAEQQKLYFYPGQGHGGQVHTTGSGYHWYNPNAHHGGTDRWMKKDYSMTTKSLVEVATYSRMAAKAANETAAAASRAASETDAAASARNFADLRTAVGNLLVKATAAEAAACVAVEMLKIANEEDDKDESTSNLIQNVAAVQGIARAIAKHATQTAEAAERAVVAINRQPMPNENEVDSSTVHTKTLAQTVLKMTKNLVTMMIVNAGPQQDSLIDTP